MREDLRGLLSDGDLVTLPVIEEEEIVGLEDPLETLSEV